jgi:RNA polymerase sigma factor (sigma-70 family)
MADPTAPTGEFAVLFERHGSQVYSFLRCHVATTEEAEDLTADVFERALVSLSKYDPSRGTSAAWLFGFAHRCLSNHLRKQRRRRQSQAVHASGALQVADRTPPPDRALLVSERQTALLNALEQLDERARRLVTLRYLCGISNSEIARITGTARGNVAVILHRTLRKLEAMLQPEEVMYEE